MTLTQTSFAAFAAVAAGGILMTFMIGLHARIPRVFSDGHGLAGLFALSLLFAANLRGGESTTTTAWWALGILLAGFTGGMLLFRVVFRHRATLPLVAMHGSLAAAGLYLLYQAIR